MALGAPDYALVSNDTRVRHYSARSGHLLCYADDARKLVALDGAWLTGGNSLTLAHWAAEYLVDWKPVDPDALRERFAEKVALAADAAHHQGLFVVQRDSDGFAIYHLDLTARDHTRKVGYVLDGAVPYVEGDPDREAQCHRLVNGLVDSTPPTLPDMVRRVARLYVDVRAITGEHGSISDLLEVGLLLPAADDGGVQQRRLGPRRAAALAEMADEEITALLEPVAPPVVARNQLASRIYPPLLGETAATFRGDHLFVSWTGAAHCRSVRVATSTSSQPAAGTGTIVEGESGEHDAGAFVYGDRVYVTVTPYSGAGATGLQGMAAFPATRRLPVIHTWVDPGTGKPKRTQDFTDGKFALKASDTAGKETDDDLFVAAAKTVKVGTVASPSVITKTLRVPHGELVPASDTGLWTFTNGYVHPRNIAAQLILYASVVLPKGCTITNILARVYRQTSSDAVTAALYRLDNSGGATTLASFTSGATGWHDLTNSLSQLVGDEHYILQVALTSNAAAADARFTYYEVTYTMPSYDKGY